MTTSSQAIMTSTSNQLERTPPSKRWQLVITKDISALMRSFLNGGDLAILRAVDYSNYWSIRNSPTNQITIAFQKAMLIPNLNLRADKLLSIAKADPTHNLEPVKTLAKSMQANDWILFEIVKAEAAWDLKAAEATAALIQNLSWKEQALFAIVKAAATVGDLETMKRVIEQMQGSFYELDASLEIVKVEVVHDLAAAKARARRINDTIARGKALLEIVKVEVAHDDLAAANATLNTMIGPSRAEAFDIIERAAIKHKAN